MGWVGVGVGRGWGVGVRARGRVGEEARGTALPSMNTWSAAAASALRTAAISLASMPSSGGDARSAPA